MSSSIWKLSAEAAKYAQARPSHPKEIVTIAKKFLREEYAGPAHQAVDVGCGTGLSTQNLYGEFEHNFGVDSSQAMIDQANMRNLPGSLVFETSSAENLPVGSESTQLILSGRAIHYFDIPKFFKEVDRVLIKKGVLCYYSVDFPAVSSAVNAKFGARIHDLFWSHLKSPQLSGHWPINPSNQQVVNWDRRNFYFNAMRPPYEYSRTDETVSGQRETSIEQLAAELSTYSAIVNLREKDGDKAADDLLNEFTAAGHAIASEEGAEDASLVATDNFFMVMARKP